MAKDKKNEKSDLYDLEMGRYRASLKAGSQTSAEKYGFTLINSLTPAERALALKDLGFEITDAVDFYNLGVQAANEENWSGAIEHFKHAVEIDVDLIDAIYNLAICYEKTGHNPQAKSTWEVYLDLCSDEEEAATVREHIAEL